MIISESLPTGDVADIRPGEMVTSGLLSRDAALTFIGCIETPWTSRSDCPRQGDHVSGPVCKLHIAPQWAPALDGVEAHATLQVLYWMHEARRDLVRLAPRSRSHGDPRGRGPFALRAPTRPNPIASSIVQLIGRQNAVLFVRGLDCLNGTPLLDIKPWRSPERE